MDYQTFSQLPLQNTQQHHPQPPFSTISGASAPAAHAQPAHSPQQQPALYAAPQARFQQPPSSQLLQYNGQAAGFPLASSMGGGSVVASSGAMMQPSNLSQHQLHQARGEWTAPSLPPQTFFAERRNLPRRAGEEHC